MLFHEKKIWTLYEILPNPVNTQFSVYLLTVPYCIKTVPFIDKVNQPTVTHAQSLTQRRKLRFGDKFIFYPYLLNYIIKFAYYKYTGSQNGSLTGYVALLPLVCCFVLFQSGKSFGTFPKHEKSDIDVLVSYPSLYCWNHRSSTGYLAILPSANEGCQQQEPIFIQEQGVDAGDLFSSQVPEYISNLRRMKFVETLLRRKLCNLQFSNTTYLWSVPGKQEGGMYISDCMQTPFVYLQRLL